MPFSNKGGTMSNDVIKDLITIIIVFMPPIIFFAKYYLEEKGSIIILAIICILYTVTIPFTQNLVPFIFVLLDIRYIKRSEKYRYVTLRQDYERYDFGFNNFKIGEALAYSFGSYIISILIAAVIILIMNETKVPVKNQEIIDMLQKTDILHFLITIPVAVIFAPIVEEFVFRYLIFEKLFKNRVGLNMAIILSSLMFGIIHFNLKAFAPIVFIGIVNCYLIHKRGYWYAVFNHFVFNLIPIISMLIIKISK